MEERKSDYLRIPSNNQAIELKNFIKRFPTNVSEKEDDQEINNQEEDLRLSRYIVTDFMTNINEATKVSFNLDQYEKVKLSKFQKLLRSFHILNPSAWVHLAILGVISAIVAFAVDFVAAKLLEARMVICINDYMSFTTGLVMWLIFGLFFGVVAALCGAFLSQDAEGSGIPEMKSILAGVNIFRFLSFPTLSSKIVGLIAASGAGLSIGKEGPFVHISAIIAHKLCKHVPFFKHILENTTLHNQILASAVATGVCATFGAPIGGVLFSIEVTATYYVVSNLWKAFYCAVWCSLMFTILHQTELTDLIYVTKYTEITFNWQVISFLLLGVICGVLGATFVTCASKLICMRKAQVLGSLSKRFPYTILVCIVCSLITFSSPFFQLSDKKVINDMFQADSLYEIEDSRWVTPNIYVSLLVFTLAKLFMTSISISCPIPCGVFTPIFTTGAVFGRLWGGLMNWVFGFHLQGVYAIVGAAALTSSVTHTISVAVIVFELTGQLNYMTYMLVGVLISFAVGNAISISIYDVMLQIKGLPYMPALRPSRLYKKKAKHVMVTRLSCLSKDSTLKELWKVFIANMNELYIVPVLDEENFLIGEITLKDLRKHFHQKFLSAKREMSNYSSRMLSKYFERVYQLSTYPYVSYI